MAQFQVERSLIIEAPAEQVFALLRNFRQWPHWSPWLVVEPEATLEFSADGRGYRWEGDVIGAGSIHVLRDSPPRSIHLELCFVKPWKCTSPVSFRLAPADGGTRVTWTMTGSLPFFLFFMRGMMSAWLGMDFDRGLQRLKDLAETGAVPSRLERLGARAFPGCRYVGLSDRCETAQIGPSMEANFARLEAWRKGAGVELTGVPLAIYHKWDLSKGLAAYTLGFPVEAPPAELPEGLTAGEIPACETFDIQHTGPYRHLANAWAAAMMMRGKRFKSARGIDPFETYESDPAGTPANEIVTVVHMPVRG